MKKKIKKGINKNGKVSRKKGFPFELEPREEPFNLKTGLNDAT